MSRCLTKDEAKKIAEAAGNRLGWLSRLRGGMERAGFSPQDEIYRAVAEAQSAMQSLFMRAHYRSCSGVGRAEDDD